MGTNTRVRKVETVSPPMTEIAREALASAPSPKPSAMGINPQMVVSVVITIGLSLIRPALHNGFSQLHTVFLTEPVDVFDENDRVADDNPDHHDDPDERDDAQGIVRQEKRPHNADESPGALKT